MMALSLCGRLNEIEALLDGIGRLNGVRIAPGRRESWTDGDCTICVLADVNPDVLKRERLRMVEMEAEP